MWKCRTSCARAAGPAAATQRCAAYTMRYRASCCAMCTCCAWRAHPRTGCAGEPALGPRAEHRACCVALARCTRCLSAPHHRHTSPSARGCPLCAPSTYSTSSYTSTRLAGGAAGRGVPVTHPGQRWSAPGTKWPNQQSWHTRCAVGAPYCCMHFPGFKYGRPSKPLLHMTHACSPTSRGARLRRLGIGGCSASRARFPASNPLPLPLWSRSAMIVPSGIR